MDSNVSPFIKNADGAYYCYYCGTPEAQRHGKYCPHREIVIDDPEPQPSDGPEYHADHAAWVNRVATRKCCKHCENHPSKDQHSVRCTMCAEEENRANMEEVIEIKSESAPDMVNSPSHYTGPVPGIECIDVTRHFSLLRGTAIKYLWRADYKNNKVEDLKKAIWYIQKELDTLEDW